jgi:cold shock CspA family protein
MSSDTQTTSTNTRLTGMVKWFNSKSGFGFITVCSEDDKKGKDIFVHFSAIRVADTQYKYLVQGEYVDFDLVPAQSGEHEFHAADVCGVNGGTIMCETRRNTLAQSSRHPPSDSSERRYRFREVDERREPRYSSDSDEHRSSTRRESIYQKEPREPREPRESRYPRDQIRRPAASYDQEYTRVEKRRNTTTDRPNRPVARA